MKPSKTLEEVQQLAAEFRIIPLTQTLFSGNDTPLSIYEKLTDGRPGSFLLESADQGVWSRYSFIGVNSRGSLIKQRDGLCKWVSTSGEFALPDSTSKLADGGLDSIEAVIRAWPSHTQTDLPPLTSGLVGMIGWNIIREIEDLKASKPSDYESPDVCLSMVSDMVIVDHLTGNLVLLANVFVVDGQAVESAYEAALARLVDMKTNLLKPAQSFLAEIDFAASGDATSRTTRVEFLDSVEQAKDHVKKGDVFQVVLSQRFDQRLDASPLDCYRVLRSINPSPYMYLLNLSDESGDFSVVGSSPEALVTVAANAVTMHPIAGSRPRGKNTDDDNALAAGLIEDAKETAEHLMLVDLARNDLLKVCDPASVEVSEFMQIRRFSHIMHLVSTVEGALSAEKSVVDVFRATFPAGTLSGAPKPKALEIIERLEPTSRGIFGGVVGYFDFAGNADLAIAIRTAFIRDSVAHVQAGAGIVLDSDPSSEFAETVNKARATLAAIAAANEMRVVNE
ncbi:MAG: anthranilate synthase component I [Actinobacteria bacterium]|uniref:anthranilate synthase n=1 Tax=freshwater metagenome TaxID=449393 RepID=A0A6J6N998_9ZZZZ|nr:anthranilate synthase component I [Actinomycetota bacterium]